MKPIENCPVCDSDRTSYLVYEFTYVHLCGFCGYRSPEFAGENPPPCVRPGYAVRKPSTIRLEMVYDAVEVDNRLYVGSSDPSPEWQIRPEKFDVEYDHTAKSVVAAKERAAKILHVDPGDVLVAKYLERGES